MNTNGYIKIYRSLLDWQWYSDINVKVLFIHLLLTANWEDTVWHGVKIQRGQRAISITRLSAEVQLTPQQTRTALNKLKSTGSITMYSTSKYSVVTINNYDSYQEATCTLTSKQHTVQQTAQHAPQQANNTQPNNNINNKEINNIRNNKKEINKEKANCKHKYGEYRNVLLSDSELQKLKSEFPNDWEERIDRLSLYIGSTGKRYSSHYLTILSWARREVKKNGNNSNHETGKTDVPEYGEVI